MGLKRAIFITVIAAFLFFSPAAAQLPEPRGFVNDYADVLGGHSGEIENLAADVEKSTSAEIAVVTISGLPEGYDIFTYGVELFEKWGIGKKSRDNGVLVHISVREKKWRIEVGYGIEPVINDAKAGRIGRETIEKAFETGEYGKEAYNAVSMIAAEIKGEPSPDPVSSIISFIQNDPLTFAVIVMLLAAAIAILVLTGNGWILYAVVRIILLILSRGRFGGGRSGGGGAGRFIRLPAI